MDNLYRLVKAGGFCFRTFGVRIGVRVDDPAMIKRIESYLPAGWSFDESIATRRLYSLVVNGRMSRPGLRHYHFLYCNSQSLARTLNEEELLETFESDLNAYIAQAARNRFFVHAGVIEWKGKAIVIPGCSKSGKTTLVQEFVRYGAKYYSDEFAVFDRRGYVHPFARPLAIRQRTTHTKIRVSAAQLGGKTGIKPLPVGLLLFTAYRASARWNPRAISPGRGAIEVLKNTLCARQRPASTLAFLQRAAQGSCLLRGVRGEARDLVEAVLESLESQPQLGSVYE